MVSLRTCLVIVLVATGTAFAGGRAVALLRLPLPGTPPWKHEELPKVERRTDYAVVREGGQPVLQAHARCSASALVLEAPDVDLRQTPVLSWRWKVTRPLPEHDERTKAGDDFALRVYVMFRFDPDRAGWWERARHTLGSRLAGADLPGSAISYVWTVGEPPGAAWPNPFAADVRMVSLGPGRAGTWRQAAVDVVQDYRRLFGVDPPPVAALGVMSDADNLCAEAEAYLAGLEWRAAAVSDGRVPAAGSGAEE